MSRIGNHLLESYVWMFLRETFLNIYLKTTTAKITL